MKKYNCQFERPEASGENELTGKKASRLSLS